MSGALILFLTTDGEDRSRVTALLEERGLEVRSGGDGSESLAWEAPPDLLLVDTRLRGVDAASVIARLRRDGAGECPPVLVLGDRDDAEAALAAMRAGADDVVLRPLDALGLPARIEGLIARQRVAVTRDECRTLEFRNQELESFIYIVTHDMKTPVVNLQGLVGLIEQDHADDLPEAVREYLGRLRRNAERLEELLRDLLEYPRRLRILGKIEDCNVKAVASEAVDGLREISTARGVDVAVAPDLPTISADPRRLQQVFHNLVENAVKHANGRPNPRVEVGWSKTPHGPLFHVRDNGPGIPPDDLESVFKLFQRGSGATDGTGIGLAVARQLVEAHGGEIWAESGPEEGSTFLFRLGQ